MRLRTIKPGFFSNDMLAEVEPLGRLLFAGLWCMADRAGRLEDRPRRIKAEVLPYDECDADALLDQLAARGFILRYEANGARYIQVVHFAKHQYPNQREPQSVIPAPSQDGPSDAPDAHDACTVPTPSPHGTSGNSHGNSLGEREQGGAGGGARSSHVSPISLSLVKASDTEAEAATEAYSPPPADPRAEREADHALLEAWCQAVGHVPKGSERRSWVKNLGEMRRDYGLSPPGVPPVVAQYRALKGADKCPTPGQVNALWSQLGAPKYVAAAIVGTNGHRGSVAPSDPDAEARERRERRAALERYGVPVAPERPSPNGHVGG